MSAAATTRSNGEQWRSKPFVERKKKFHALAVKSVLFGAIASLYGAVEFGFGLKPKRAALSTGQMSASVFMPRGGSKGSRVVRTARAHSSTRSCCYGVGFGHGKLIVIDEFVSFTQ